MTFVKQKEDSMKGFGQFLFLKNLNPSTVECYLRYYRLLKPLVEKLGLTQEMIDTWLIEHKNHKQIRAFVKNYLEYLDNEEIRLRRITGKSSPKKRMLMSDADMINVIDVLYEYNYRYGILIDIMSDTGIRRAEALDIKPEDFAWDVWFKDKTRRCKLKIRGKGRKERFVQVKPSIMEKLQHHANNIDLNEGEVFIQTNRTSLTEVFQKACKVVLGKKYGLHDIRRATANRWSRGGLTLEQIRIRLGHKSVKTTELYVQPQESVELELWKNE